MEINATEIKDIISLYDYDNDVINLLLYQSEFFLHWCYLYFMFQVSAKFYIQHM